MVVITFNGAINVDNVDLYSEIFNGARVNPNGCQIKGTYFVSHKYTNYSAVQVNITLFYEIWELYPTPMLFPLPQQKFTVFMPQELHRQGHEIASFSVTNKDDPKYWTEGSYDGKCGIYF